MSDEWKKELAAALRQGAEDAFGRYSSSPLTEAMDGVANSLDPPEPEPEFKPGELLMDTAHDLCVMSQDGARWIDGRVLGVPYKPHHVATTEEIEAYVMAHPCCVRVWLAYMASQLYGKPA